MMNADVVESRGATGRTQLRAAIEWGIDRLGGNASRRRTGWAMTLLWGFALACSLVQAQTPRERQSASSFPSASDDRAEAVRPNVLFLAVDDLRDWVACLGGYRGTVHTPNMDRLARQGMLFTSAHCPSPKCAPSRAAVMTGLRPSTTGLYDNSHWWYPNLPDAVTIPAHFRQHGYRVVGAGKIFHHTAGNHPPNQWDDYLPLRFRNDPWFRGSRINYPWCDPAPYPSGFPFSGVKGLPHENDWGALPIDESDYDDARSVDYVIRFLEQSHAKPFFLACGIFRPHLPWYVPQEYLDQYRPAEVVLPSVNDHDLDDIPEPGLAIAASRRSDLVTIRRAGKQREAIAAYLASITFADAQLGRVLRALDDSRFASNTIVVLWSDHGWHLGEKEHWHKWTLWREATRVPLMIRVPRFQPGRCDQPVNLVDLFPTLIELCDLPNPGRLDGRSLVPLLESPRQNWPFPAVIELLKGNAAVCDQRYRYIRYADGSEELYDHQNDPQEWHNLAQQPESVAIKQRLAKSIPSQWAKPALTKKAFVFDPATYAWTNRQTGEVIRGKP